MRAMNDRLATLGAGLALCLRLGRTPCVPSHASSAGRVQLENRQSDLRQGQPTQFDSKHPLVRGGPLTVHARQVISQAHGRVTLWFASTPPRQVLSPDRGGCLHDLTQSSLS
ncbi:hypothetical protein THAOC_23048 [Thalassiosira oceanica]|uniref:Secreted protein n=1 Tax=Thalassiosira oceanica TaxID=159749 RepID=K0RSZ0_THAOC|nr:hypothetical protein THAOC_23048 [Thalassiosira oceanica]|eukprot:EJK56963.1 hypothetical protein THAOC_23048 [Thalassiosira oceanica]